MFDIDDLIVDLRAAVDETEPRRAVREVLERAMSEPGEIAEAMDPQEGGITLVHHTPELTVLNVVWAPGMELYPHDHRMWAAIGIYEGIEDNAFFRRPSPDAKTLVDSGGKHLHVGDTIVLGDDVIHSVANPGRKLTGAIHVYGGDFVNQPRSQWGPGPEVERPYDIEDAYRQFAAANEAWRASMC
jgi:predicted metal-dependent enzyme (double-stranded beta helix superfamily)